MEDPNLSRLVKRLNDLSKGIASHELEAITLELRVYKSSKLAKATFSANSSFPVASPTVMEIGISLSVDYTISFHSSAMIQEEVEIEAKVVGERGRLLSVVVEVRRKQNGDLVALGKQWMSPSPGTSSRQPSKL